MRRIRKFMLVVAGVLALPGCTVTRELARADFLMISQGGTTLVASNVVVNAYKPADLLGAAVKGAVGALK